LAFCAFIALNVRALAAGNILVTVVTNVLLASVSFVIIRRVGEASTKLDFVGYIFGGACGSAIALLLAR
jgi:hypothetical protein